MVLFRLRALALGLTSYAFFFGFHVRMLISYAVIDAAFFLDIGAFLIFAFVVALVGFHLMLKRMPGPAGIRFLTHGFVRITHHKKKRKKERGGVSYFTPIMKTRNAVSVASFSTFPAVMAIWVTATPKNSDVRTQTISMLFL